MPEEMNDDKVYNFLYFTEEKQLRIKKDQDQLERLYNQNVNQKDSVRMGVMDWNKSMEDVRDRDLREKNTLQKSQDHIGYDQQQKYKDILSEQVQTPYNQF